MTQPVNVNTVSQKNAGCYARVWKILGWFLVVLLGTALLGSLALHQGEKINAVWLMLAAILVYLLAYRYYSRFLAFKVVDLSPTAVTPAVRHHDGLDYVPTNQHVLFGHHFAAIAGAGPLVGPVLAAQMGYLPGILWIVIGAVFAGAVQDFMILTFSMRRDGRSLGEIIRLELGLVPGIAAMLSVLMIMVIILAVLALIVVKALTNSPWSLFTVTMTIPIGLWLGVHLRYLRPGKVGEASVIGFALLMFAIVGGRWAAEHPVLGPLFTLDGVQLTACLVGYGFFASILPVWLLLAPRDYLSTFLKIGTIVALGVATFFIAPEMKMPAVTQFIGGGGPVWSGALFPFLFITVACGAVSGFHALISSGTTPKMVENEVHTRLIGYGAMLLESFVAVMALIAACCLEPGLYFALNSPAAVIGTTVDSAVQTISSWGFVLTPEMLAETAENIGESSILSRTGGAPTLAIGIASIFAQLFDNQTMLAFWYHFAILFEALFILTAVDAGTRAGRFILQDTLGACVPWFRRTESWGANLISTALCVMAWGYFLYQGVVDPFGGINTLWPLFGISNQMLAGIALLFSTVVLVRMKKAKWVWVTVLPMVWIFICTFFAGWQKVFSVDPSIGFLAHAKKYGAALESEVLLAPARSFEQMAQIVVNDRIDAGLLVLFVGLTLCILGYSAQTLYRSREPVLVPEKGPQNRRSVPTRCC